MFAEFAGTSAALPLVTGISWADRIIGHLQLAVPPNLAQDSYLNDPYTHSEHKWH